MKFNVLTIFPEILAGALKESILGKAIDKGIIELNLVDTREYAQDKHRMVDDYPYGGGPGMVMKPEPIFLAAESLETQHDIPVILLSPQGEVFNQELARELSEKDELVIICGRYEGVDERIIEGLNAREVSIGDYVITGGEFAALVIIDAVSRLIPGVLGDDRSCEDESFTTGLLEYPHYTRPASFRKLGVPDVLISGNHGRINRWRKERSLERTLKKRPDLLEKADLTEEDLEFLKSLGYEPESEK